MRKLRQNVDVPLSKVTHDIDQIKKEYSIPSAFEKYTEYAGIRRK